MQFLEWTFVGLRSVAWRLSSPRYRCRLLLLPMVHIGEAAFYTQVKRQLGTADIVLYEAVRHPLAARLSRWYRWLAVSPRLGLVAQHQQDLWPQGGQEFHCIDMPQDVFDAAWRKFPWAWRAFITVLMPAFFVYARLFLTREFFGKTLARKLSRGEDADSGGNDDDGMSELEAAAAKEKDFAGAFLQLILHDRDAWICKEIDRVLAERDGDVTIAILFGAGHMPKILRHLSRTHGFRASAKGEWMTVWAADW